MHSLSLQVPVATGSEALVANWCSDALQCAVYGSFSAAKAQEIIASRGKILELLRPDENGKLQTVCSTEVFGVIRSLMPFRLTGGGKDYLVIGSDSGRLVIVEYSKASRTLLNSTESIPYAG